MRIDLSVMVWDPYNKRPYSELLDELTEAAQAAEEAKFGSIWLAEHHFQEEGFDISPNPVMLGAHVANHTKNLRISVGAVMLPLWNPIRAAEDIAILDQIAKGRVDVSIGRGITPRDVVNLNPNADRRDPEKSMAVWNECVDVLLGSWKDEAFSYEGQYYRYPQPNVKSRSHVWYEHNPARVTDDLDIIALSVLPKPFQHPHPPLYNVSETAEGFAYAAERDLGAITWFPNGSKLQRVLDAYHTTSAKFGRPVKPGERCGLMRPGFVATTAERVREVLTPAAENLAGSMGGHRGMVAFCDEGDPASGPVGDETWYDFLVQRDQFFAGTPDDVIKTLRAYRDKYKIEHFVMWLNPYGVPHQDLMNAIELYGRYIIPAVT